jgi:ABC-type glycerol-3-phosphate transport system permease component
MAAIAGVSTNRPTWMEKPSRISSVAKGVILVVIAILMLFPFVYVLAVSLSSNQDVIKGGLILFPAHPTLDAYRAVLGGGAITHALQVSIGVTIIGTAGSMAFTTTLAYGLTRTRQAPGTKIVLYLVLGTLLFSPGIIPNYLLIRYLGLLDNYAALVLPGLINAFNLIVIRQFFMNIPEELTDSAYMDGANAAQVFWHIVLPLSKPVLAVIALFYGVGYWGDYFTALLYLNDSSKWPIQLVLRLYVIQGEPVTNGVQAVASRPMPPSEAIQMAVVVLATIPILLVYPFLQRYFTRGVLTGAIKG